MEKLITQDDQDQPTDYTSSFDITSHQILNHKPNNRSSPLPKHQRAISRSTADLHKRRNKSSIYEECTYTPLPDAFEGGFEIIGGERMRLKMPNYLESSASSVTLPSRLELLGNRDFRLLAAAQPLEIGNTIVGFDYDFFSVLYSKIFGGLVRPMLQLYLLPFVFSKAMARMMIFLRSLFLFIFLIYGLNAIEVMVVNVGRAWVIGTFLTFAVLYNLSKVRWSPDGVMIFCRSMGVPEVEEYMFSYSWKFQEEAIRTLAKAVWNAGVGVWIDVVKLTPGDEIRPVVRTMARSVNRVVVFLSNAYIKSPNCCVEFWEAVQTPNRLVICVLEPLPVDVENYIRQLEKEGSKVVNGIFDLVPILHAEITDSQDESSYNWWKSQNIAGGGVPESICPNEKWSMIPNFSLWGQVFLPLSSIQCGPVYLAGNCLDAGKSLRLPWFFIVALTAVCCNAFDIFLKFVYDPSLHTLIDYVWLSVILICNLSPFWAGDQLFETRVFCDTALKPLLASKSIDTGVMIDVIGEDTDRMVIALRTFLESIGHLYHPSKEELAYLDKYHLPLIDKVEVKANDAVAENIENVTPSPERESYSYSAKVVPLGSTQKHKLPQLQIQVMNNLEHRDAIFGGLMRFDAKKTIFIWSGQRLLPDGKISDDPFTDDDIGRRMMRYLCLIKAWEGVNLADSLFSALGIRVVDAIHVSE